MMHKRLIFSDHKLSSYSNQGIKLSDTLTGNWRCTNKERSKWDINSYYVLAFLHNAMNKKGI